MACVRQGGVSIVQGEVSLLLSSMRRGNRWSGHVRTVRWYDRGIQVYKLETLMC